MKKHDKKIFTLIEHIEILADQFIDWDNKYKFTQWFSLIVSILCLSIVIIKKF